MFWYLDPNTDKIKILDGAYVISIDHFQVENNPKITALSSE